MSHPPRTWGLPELRPDGALMDLLIRELGPIHRGERHGAVLITLDTQGTLRANFSLDSRNQELTAYTVQRLIAGLDAMRAHLSKYAPEAP